MARNVALVAFGIVVGVFGGAAFGLRADETSRDVHEAAAAAGVSEQDLAGALSSLSHAGVSADPYSYLRSTGELPPVTQAPTNSRVACIIRVESRGDPNAHNRSGASGLGQFLPGTWMTTPQGKAGLSVYNADANRAAIQYMLDAGRAREFDAVRFYGC